MRTKESEDDVSEAAAPFIKPRAEFLGRIRLVNRSMS